MCTVTYISQKNGFFFTSNRDEQPKRKTINPAYYKEQGVKLFYPKDKVAGGTWIGLSEKNRLVCLLNGGFKYHNPTVKFPKSRGVVVKTILQSTDVKKVLKTISLTGVAPFTLIVVDWANQKTVYELVWCQEKKYIKELNADEPHMWSSSTLYTDEMKIERQNWFHHHVLSISDSTKDKILEFHQNSDLGNIEIAPKMKREMVATISTTLIEKKDEELSLEYHDYTKNNALLYKGIFADVKFLDK